MVDTIAPPLFRGVADSRRVAKTREPPRWAAPLTSRYSARAGAGVAALKGPTTTMTTARTNRRNSRGDPRRLGRRCQDEGLLCGTGDDARVSAHEPSLR